LSTHCHETTPVGIDHRDEVGGVVVVVVVGGVVVVVVVAGGVVVVVVVGAGWVVLVVVVGVPLQVTVTCCAELGTTDSELPAQVTVALSPGWRLWVVEEDEAWATP
jgi:hypothetical protein